MMKSLARRAARKPDRRTDDGVLTEYLGFGIAGANYAVPVTLVREIVRGAQLTPVPRAPLGVLGIASFRGRVVTVVDLGTRLGRDGATFQPLPAPMRLQKLRILMIDVGQETIGFLVDEVHQVYRFAARDVERSNTLGADVGQHVTGIARPNVVQATDDPGSPNRDHVVLILDPKALTP
jgi:purine-binding chemotaxis protein CheW